MFDVGCSMFGVRCWMLDVGCWMLVVRCWMLVVRCWMLVVRCWMLVVRCWMLVVRCSVLDIPNLRTKILPSPRNFAQILRHMKLLVFAHTPPPPHGQSCAVQSMLNSFGGDCRKPGQKSPGRFGIECYHVNARFSKSLEDIGADRGGKVFLILFFCLQAIWCRFRQ